MTRTPIANLRGPQGLDGAGAPAADAATASYLTGPSQSRTALNGVVNLRAIAVADYGPLGTSDDSATINAALADASGRRLVFPPNAVLNCGENTLSDASDTTIDGNGATLVLKSTGARIAGLKLMGACDNVQVERLRVKGNATVADHHAGITGPSGQSFSDIRVVNCSVEDTTLGISFSADGGGSIDGLLYEGNRANNIVGTVAGDGYGLHVAASGTSPNGVRMIGNKVESAQRHSIYFAKGVGGTILGNVIRNHRDAILDGTILPAINISRSKGVSLIGNQVQNSAGGALYLGGIGGGDHAGEYEVIGNVFSGAVDGAALVYIGQLAPSTDGFPTGVDFSHNTLSSSVARNLMTIYNGKDMSIRANRFLVRGVGGMSALTLNGAEETANNYLDNVDIDSNLFDLDAANPTSKIAIRLSPDHGTDTTRYWFNRNRLIAGAAMFAVSENVTNPNITITDQVATGMTGWVPVARPILGPSATAAPAAGGASALPATPAGYLTLNVNGTDRKVAYY